MGLAVNVLAQTQTITPNNTKFILPANTVFNFNTQYNTNPTDNTLSGLTLRAHFDSTKLSTSLASITTLSTNRTGQELVDDSNNEDGNSSTNQRLNILWADLGQNWPNQTLPLTVLQATFTTASSVFTGNTAINFTGSPATGYAFTATSIIITNTPDINSGNNQTVGAGNALNTFVLNYGSNNAGVSVIFTAPSGASFAGVSTETVTTDSSGIATSSALNDTALGSNKAVVATANGFADRVINYTITPGSVEPASTTLVRQGSGDISADSSAIFSITLRDRFGNQITNSSGIALAPTGVESYATVSITNNNNGSAVAIYRLMSAGLGDDNFSISANGSPIGQSATVSVVAGAVNTSESSLTLSSSFTVSQSVRILVGASNTRSIADIMLKDQFGNSITNITGLSASVSLFGATASFNSNGSLTYTPFRTGTETLILYINNIEFTRLIFVVNAGPLDRITLSSANNRTTLLANGSDNIVLTASLFDANNNLVMERPSGTMLMAHQIIFNDDDTTNSTITLSNTGVIDTTTGTASITATSAANEAEGSVIITVMATGTSSGSVTIGSITITARTFGLNNRNITLIRGDSFAFSVVGSNNTSWTNASNAIGSLSRLSGDSATFTASSAGITTITINDTVASIAVSDMAVITVHSPLTTDISADIALITNSTRILSVNGGDNSYVFTPSNSAISVSNGTIVADSVGSATINVNDGISYDGQRLTNSITTAVIYVVDQLAVNASIIYLDTVDNTTATIGSISGGRGNNIYSSNNTSVVSIDSSGILTRQGAGNAIITIRDSQFSNITTTRLVVVSAPIRFVDNNTQALPTTPTIRSGSRFIFSVSGGAGNKSFAISGNNSSEASITRTARNNYLFNAPQTGAFAGIYTITVSDNSSSFTKQQQVVVPLRIDLRSGILSGGGNNELSRAIISITGGSTNDTITLSATDLITFSTNSITPVSVRGQNIATASISSSAVNEVLIEAISVSHTISGVPAVIKNIRLLPADVYTGTVVDVTGASPVIGASIIIRTSRNIFSTSSNNNGIFNITVPKLVSGFHQLIINHKDYNATMRRGANYRNANNEQVILQTTGYIISGNVNLNSLPATTSYDLYARQSRRGGEVFGPFAFSTNTYAIRLTPNTYDLYVEKSGYIRGGVRVVLDSTNTVTRDINLILRPTLRYQVNKLGNDVVFSEISNADIVGYDVVDGNFSEVGTSGNKGVTVTLANNPETNQVDITTDTPLLLRNSLDRVVFVYQHIGETPAEATSVYVERDKIPEDQLGGAEVVAGESGFSVNFNRTRASSTFAETAVMRSLRAVLPPNAIDKTRLLDNANTNASIAQDATITNAFISLTPVNLANGNNTLASGSGGTFFRLDLQVQVEGVTASINANKAFSDDAQMEISMEYDNTSILRDDWISGRVRIYHANTLVDLESGNYTTIQISANNIDEINGVVTFTTTSLSGFSIGDFIENVISSGGGGCSLKTSNTIFDPMLPILVLLLLGFLFKRRIKKTSI